MAINSLFMQAYPAVFEQLAFDSGAFTRARKIKSPAQLMQCIMLYCGQDLSLPGKTHYKSLASMFRFNSKACIMLTSEILPAVIRAEKISQPRLMTRCSLKP